MTAAYAKIGVDRPPAAVRRALEEAEREGAVWDGILYALLAKAERRNPVSWVINEEGLWQKTLAAYIRSRLSAAYTDRKAAGDIADPDHWSDIEPAGPRSS